MSLTSIIARKRIIREGLRTRIVRPKIHFGVIKASPLTKNYGIVGTAFDYLFRFRLQRINEVAQTGRWVAEEGVELIKVFLPKADPQWLMADKYLAEAKAQHRSYLTSGVISSGLLKSAMRLAHFDVAYRVGLGYLNWQAVRVPDPKDIADLRAQLGLIDESAFKAIRCLLPKSDIWRSIRDGRRC